MGSRLDTTTSDLVAAVLYDLVAESVCVRAASLLGAEAGVRARVEPADGDGALALLLAQRARAVLGVHFRVEGRTPPAHAQDGILAIAGDPRAVMIALADRLVTLRGLRDEPLAARALAEQMLAVWAPLSDRLGLARLGREMEDLSFRLVDRAAYDAVARLVARRKVERDRCIEGARAALEGELAACGIRAEVSGRAKHLWSVHHKLLSRGGSASLHDLFGVRAVVDTVDQCYEALGVAHEAFEPVPGRFKDYIARPKPNGYRSLHTAILALIDGREELIEVQIRTREMHTLAEYGLAAHWRYKQGEGGPAPEDHHVYALTPAGEIKRLPRGATTLDFAYSVHTALGHGFIGAKVNGRMANAGTKLRTGDVVEVLRSARAKPTEGQIARVRTARARNRIRAAISARAV